MIRNLFVALLLRLNLYHPVVDGINRYKFKRQSILMKKNGLEMLSAAESAFNEAGIKAFLTYGCLLGAYREHGFISYDPDIDLGIISDQIPENMDEVLKRYGFRPFRANYLNDSNKTIVEKTYEYKKMHLDIFQYFKDGNELYSVIQRKHETKEWKEANNTDGFPCDRSYVPSCEFEETDFLGVRVWIPSDADGWLRAIYSDSYMTPIRNWDLKDGYVTRIVHSNERSYRLYY